MNRGEKEIERDKKIREMIWNRHDDMKGQNSETFNRPMSCDVKSSRAL